MNGEYAILSCLSSGYVVLCVTGFVLSIAAAYLSYLKEKLRKGDRDDEFY